MKILFVHPCQGRNEKNKPSLTDKLFLHVPSTLPQLAALTPENHKIDIVDESHYHKINFEKKYDLVAITCMTMHVMRAYKISERFRQKGIPVVLGGYHPSALPEEAKKYSDSVVIGEAEISWPKLLNDFENNNLQPFYRQETFVDPKLIPPVKRDTLQGYYPLGVQASRGCPFRCDYCSIQNVEGHQFRKRPIENVIDEIKNMKTNYFAFTDPSLTVDLDFTKTLFKELKKLKKRFDCHGNINILNDNEDLIKLSKDAGCQAWYIGFESISKESLESVHKTNNPEIYPEGIKKIRKYGISVNGLFMFGFDGDKLDIFNKTLKAIKEWKIDIASFAILTPFPGTPVYKRFEEEGRILTKDWSKYYFNNIVFNPKNMTKEELFNKTRELTKQFYSLSSTFNRTFDTHHLSFSNLLNKFKHNLVDRHLVKKEFNF